MLFGLFWVALAYNVYGVTYNWTMGYMSGHEFRQAHTAIVAYYIDKQDNFSLLYETPIFGKPWVSLLLEVPIYEWTVVLLSRATGLSHLIAARTVAAACFYLTLPAVWLLLARLGWAKPRRFLVLALILTAPVYIYYSRAFLMDSMALMFSAWWLVAFVRTMDDRRWGWLLLTAIAGTAAALIKSAVLAVWLLPGAGYGLWLLWQDLRAGRGWRALAATAAWGLATVAVALGLLRAWVAFTDPIKEVHASAWIFTSKNLTQGNWGLFDFGALFSSELWGHLVGCWEQALMPRWLILGGLAAGLAFRSVRRNVAVMAAPFFGAQLLFPYAYAYQDYYFYACALFVHAAFGYALTGLLDSRVPRVVFALLTAAPIAAQVATYWFGYREGQSVWHHGGYSFTELLRDHTPEDSILIVAGADWSAVTPLYAQRKALMIRNGLEHDNAYLERAFAEHADEDIGALVVFDELRENRAFIEKVAARFDIDAGKPTFSFITADIYASRAYARHLQVVLRNTDVYGHLTLPEDAFDETPSKGWFEVAPERAEETFQNIRPAPYQGDFEFGVVWLNHERRAVLSAHPRSDLWLRPPPGATAIRWTYGIFDGAYRGSEERTDGVEFAVYGELPDGQARRIYRRVLDPARNQTDRGDQIEVIPYEPRPGESLRFSTRPFETSAKDWAYTVEIEVK